MILVAIKSDIGIVQSEPRNFDSDTANLDEEERTVLAARNFYLYLAGLESELRNELDDDHLLRSIHDDSYKTLREKAFNVCFGCITPGR